MWHSFGWLPALVFLIITLGETACVLQVRCVTVSAGTGVKLTVFEMLLWSRYAKQPTPLRILLYLAFLPTEVSFQVDLHPPFILFLLLVLLCFSVLALQLSARNQSRVNTEGQK